MGGGEEGGGDSISVTFNWRMPPSNMGGGRWQWQPSFSAFWHPISQLTTIYETTGGGRRV